MAAFCMLTLFHILSDLRFGVVMKHQDSVRLSRVRTNLHINRMEACVMVIYDLCLLCG